MGDLNRNIDAGNAWRRPAEVARVVGAAGVLAIAVMRLLVVFHRRIALDIDPILFPSPIAGLGMGSSIMLDALLIVMAGIALLGELVTGRGVSWVMIMLALIPVPLVLAGDAMDDLWRGATWCAGVLAMVAIAHIARDPRWRIVILAALVAAIAPLVVRGLVQVHAEHPQAVSAFERSRDAFLAAKGWAPDSANAQMYERRLRQPEATGWFGLANVFGTFLAAGLTVSAGLVLNGVRRKRPGGFVGVVGLVGIACAYLLVINGGKGPLAAAALGCVLVCGVVLSSSMRAVLLKRSMMIALILVIAALGAVVFRGIVLSEGFANERSVLFRWHYLVAAARIMAETPLPGVGPDGFQAAYLIHKLPRSPEEVVSAHSVFIDWLAAFGALGLAWVVLVALILRSRVGSQKEEQSGQADQADLSRATVPFLATVMLAVALPVLFERYALDGSALLMRVLGVVAAVGAGYCALRLLRGMNTIITDILLIAISIVILVHSQIEMTLFLSGSTGLGMVMIGAAGGPLLPCSAAKTSGALSLVGVIVILTLGLAILPLSGGVFALRQEMTFRSIEGDLRPVGEVRQALVSVAKNPSQRSEQLSSASALAIELDEALYEAVVAASEADDSVALRDALLQADQALRRIELERRRDAGERLLDMPIWSDTCARPVVFGVEQLLTVATLGEDGQTRQESLEGLFERLDSAALQHPRAMNLQSFLARERADLSESESERREWLKRAARIQRNIIARDPHGLVGHLRLADMLWELDQTDEAAQLYRRVLEINDNLALDPLKQLNEDELARVRARAASE